MYKWETDTNIQPQKLKAQPFYIFVNGSGGVGKTHLVNTIYQAIVRVLRSVGQYPDKPIDIMTASTSKAATNLSGTTVYSAFVLSVKAKEEKHLPCKKPSSEKLQRSQLINLMILACLTAEPCNI